MGTPIDMPAPPWRVLLTCDSVGGVWTYGLDLARGLVQAGHAVTLAVLGPPPSADQRCAAEEVAGLRLVETGLPLDWTAGHPDEVRSAGAALAELASATDAHLVHLHSPALASGARLAVPVLATCHSCVRTWWAAVKGDVSLPPDLAWRADLVGEGCRRVDALTAPTRAFARSTAAAYRLESEPTVVPNGRAPIVPRELGPAPADVVAFTAGRLWDEGKNIRLLDEAAGLTGVPIIAAGATLGPNGAAIRLPRLRCPGQLAGEAVEGWLAGRPIFVSPALYEPFGLSVLEAAAHGCPLVLSDIPTFRELWDGAAVFLHPRDPAAWAAEIERLARDADARADLGRRAAARSERYGLDASLRGTLQVYAGVLTRTDPSLDGRASRSAA